MEDFSVPGVKYFVATTRHDGQQLAYPGWLHSTNVSQATAFAESLILGTYRTLPITAALKSSTAAVKVFLDLEFLASEKGQILT